MVNQAVEECIEKRILADMLRKNRSEVINLILTDYDEKFHMQTVRKEGFEEGVVYGKTHHLMLLIQKKLQKGYTIPQIAELLEEDQTVIEKLAADLQQPKEQP